MINDIKHKKLTTGKPVAGKALLGLLVDNFESITMVASSDLLSWNKYLADSTTAGDTNNEEMQVYIFWRLATDAGGGDSADATTVRQQSSNCSSFGARIFRFSGVDNTDLLNPFTTVAPATSFQHSNKLSTGIIIAPPSDAMLLGQVGVS